MMGKASRLEEKWAYFQVLCSSLIRSSPPYSIHSQDQELELGVSRLINIPVHRQGRLTSISQMTL